VDIFLISDWTKRVLFFIRMFHENGTSWSICYRAINQLRNLAREDMHYLKVGIT
jgi:hypothetical protein